MDVKRLRILIADGLIAMRGFEKQGNEKEDEGANGQPVGTPSGL